MYIKTYTLSPFTVVYVHSKTCLSPVNISSCPDFLLYQTITSGACEAEMTTRLHQIWFPAIIVHHSFPSWWRIKTDWDLASPGMGIWFLWCNCQHININEPCHSTEISENERGEIMRGCKSYCGTCMISSMFVHVCDSERPLIKHNAKAELMIEKSFFFVENIPKENK